MIEFVASIAAIALVSNLIYLVANSGWGNKDTRIHVSSIVRTTSGRDYVLTVERLDIKGGEVANIYHSRYRGSGTVFHNVGTGRRANTQMESFLSDALTRMKWEEDDRKSVA